MIKRNKKGQWDKGNNSGKRFTREGSVGNKHAKGNPPNKTSFKEGQFTMENHKNWKGGLQKHRDGYFVQVATNKRVRRSKLVWESVYGKLPQGYVMYHKDGDCYNDDIENLMAITRAELLELNRTK